MRGSLKQAMAYSSKKESRISYVVYVDYCEKNGINPKGSVGPYEFGEAPPGQGARSDLTSFTDAMAEGSTLVECALENPTTFVKYHSGFQKLAFYMGQDAASTWRSVEVVVYYGTTGVGKTRRAIEEGKQDPRGWFLMRKDDGKTLWWDGYTGQGTLILDEYRGDWMKYKGLLGVLDGHPYRVPIKGGHEWARWTRVIITSSTGYKDWYTRFEYSELDRRVTNCTELEKAEVEAEGGSGGNSNAPLASTSASKWDDLPPPAQSLLGLSGFTGADVRVLSNWGGLLLRSDEVMEESSPPYSRFGLN